MARVVSDQEKTPTKINFSWGFEKPQVAIVFPLEDAGVLNRGV